MTTQRILILGSTGSIGTQALEVIADNPDKFEVVGIAAGGSNPQLIIEQARRLNLSFDHVAVAKEDAAVSYTHLTLQTTIPSCRYLCSPYH